MIKMEICLDNETKEKLRRLARQRGRSMDSIILEALGQCLGLSGNGPAPRKASDFKFIGCAKEGHPDNISERHDESLGG